MSWNHEYIPRRFSRVRIVSRSEPVRLHNYNLRRPGTTPPVQFQTQVWKSPSSNKKIWIYCVITLVYLLLIAAIILVVVLTPRYRQLKTNVDKNLKYNGQVYSLDPRSGILEDEDDRASKFRSATTTTIMRPKVHRRNETTKYKFDMFNLQNQKQRSTEKF